MNLYFKEGGAEPCDIAQICGGALLNHTGKRVTGITSDSRAVKSGDMFVAIKGENFDGHDFIMSAFAAGAACALVERIPQSSLTGEEMKFDGKCLILCDDTIKALGAIASEYKAEINPYTVAVTGSVGKTTTKEFISSVLDVAYENHKTSGNYNNEIGLPFTLFGLEKKHTTLTVEMGMSNFGEISALSKIARPDIAVITNIGSSHIENLGSRENICRAKLEILDGLKEGGGLILNGDEPLLLGISGAFYIAFDNENADMKIRNVRESSKGTVFDLISRNGAMRDVFIPAIGRHCAFDAAVAVVIGLILGMNESEIKQGLSEYKTTGMRQNIYDAGDMRIIEDCYNASPESVKASLGVLKAVAKSESGSISLAVLGDMRELGEHSPRLHREVGVKCAELGIDKLITFGSEAQMIANGAESAGMTAEDIIVIDSTEKPQEAAEAVKTVCLGRRATILFKASRAVSLERVIELVK